MLCHDYFDAIEGQSDRGLLGPGLEVLSSLAAGYRVPWTDPWQQSPYSAGTPEGLWHTQDSDLSLLRQLPEASSTLSPQEPFDNMP